MCIEPKERRVFILQGTGFRAHVADALMVMADACAASMMICIVIHERAHGSTAAIWVRPRGRGAVPRVLVPAVTPAGEPKHLRALWSAA